MLPPPAAIPADCRVNGSEIDVAQAALTGESLPVTFYKGDSCKMGSTVVRGEVEATVEFTGIDTFFGKTASLLASTGDVSHLQKVLMSFMMILVVMSVTSSGQPFLIRASAKMQSALSSARIKNRCWWCSYSVKLHAQPIFR